MRGPFSRCVLGGSLHRGLATSARHRQTIKSGTDIFGDYLLGANNCGSWAQFMIESHALTFPAQARLCNLLGVGVGGPLARPAEAATGGVKRGYEAAQDVKKAPRNWWGELNEKAREVWEEIMGQGRE